MQHQVDLRGAVAAALARYGLKETARRLDVGQDSVLRITAGQPIRRVTEAHARGNLGQLSDVRAHTP